MLISVVPDTTWDTQVINERFEVPADMRPQLIEVVGYAVAKKAIERYEKLRHWKFDDSFTPIIDVSNIQMDLDYTDSPNTPVDIGGVDQGHLFHRKGLKAYVIKMRFITQNVVVNNIDPEVGRADGFINPDEDPRPADIIKEGIN